MVGKLHRSLRMISGLREITFLVMFGGRPVLLRGALVHLRGKAM